MDSSWNKNKLLHKKVDNHKWIIPQIYHFSLSSSIQSLIQHPLKNTTSHPHMLNHARRLHWSITHISTHPVIHPDIHLSIHLSNHQSVYLVWLLLCKLKQSFVRFKSYFPSNKWSQLTDSFYRYILWEVLAIQSLPVTVLLQDLHRAPKPDLQTKPSPFNIFCYPITFRQ